MRVGRLIAIQTAVLLGAAAWPTSAAAAPTNDDFANAQVITETTATITGTNVDATAEPGEPAHAATGATHSVWYRWTPAIDLPVTISLCESDFDTLLAVYTGTSVDALTEVVSNDDYYRSRCLGFQSEVKFAAVANTTYHIVVDGGFEETGSIVLELIDPRPEHDDFVNARSLTGYAPTASDTNTDATMQEGEPDQGGRASRSVWYRWTSPTGGVVSVDTCGSGFDTLLGVYVGDDVTGLTEIGTDDNGCGRKQSRFVFLTGPGTVFHLQVASAGSGSGRVRVRIEIPRPGGYSGRTEFLDRKPISFKLSSDGTKVEDLTISQTMDCKLRGYFLGEFKLKDLGFKSVPVGRDEDGAGFLLRAKIKLKGGTLFIVVLGSFEAPDRASGKLEARAEFRNGVTCKNWLGAVKWTARRK